MLGRPGMQNEQLLEKSVLSGLTVSGFHFFLCKNAIYEKKIKGLRSI
jgi:hypothetical protein